jgi:hypothetical protein
VKGGTLENLLFTWFSFEYHNNRLLIIKIIK